MRSTVDDRSAPTVAMSRLDQIVADLRRMELIINASFDSKDSLSLSMSTPSTPSTQSRKNSLDSIASFDQQQQLLIRQGSVRGVHNGVNSTIRRLKIRKGWKRDYQKEDRQKVVVYVTSCAVVRRTWDRCRQALSVLENLHVRFDCRDLNLCPLYYDELRNRIGTSGSVSVADTNNNGSNSADDDDCSSVWDNLPMVFVDGEYFGDEQTLHWLNDSGELKRIFDPYMGSSRAMCQKCFGFRFRPCHVCRGGKRSPLRFADLQFRCVKCDDNGIVACQDCSLSSR